MPPIPGFRIGENGWDSGSQRLQLLMSAKTYLLCNLVSVKGFNINFEVLQNFVCGIVYMRSKNNLFTSLLVLNPAHFAIVMCIAFCSEVSH